MSTCPRKSSRDTGSSRNSTPWRRCTTRSSATSSMSGTRHGSSRCGERLDAVERDVRRRLDNLGEGQLKDNLVKSYQGLRELGTGERGSLCAPGPGIRGPEASEGVAAAEPGARQRTAVRDRPTGRHRKVECPGRDQGFVGGHHHRAAHPSGAQPAQRCRGGADRLAVHRAGAGPPHRAAVVAHAPDGGWRPRGGRRSLRTRRDLRNVVGARGIQATRARGAATQTWSRSWRKNSRARTSSSRTRWTTSRRPRTRS